MAESRTNSAERVIVGHLETKLKNGHSSLQPPRERWPLIWLKTTSNGTPSRLSLLDFLPSRSCCISSKSTSPLVHFRFLSRKAIVSGQLPLYYLAEGPTECLYRLSRSHLSPKSDTLARRVSLRGPSMRRKVTALILMYGSIASAWNVLRRRGRSTCALCCTVSEFWLFMDCVKLAGLNRRQSSRGVRLSAGREHHCCRRCLRLILTPPAVPEPRCRSLHWRERPRWPTVVAVGPLLPCVSSWQEQLSVLAAGMPQLRRGTPGPLSA
jgi:hypothetical protein